MGNKNRKLAMLVMVLLMNIMFVSSFASNIPVEGFGMDVGESNDLCIYLQNIGTEDNTQKVEVIAQGIIGDASSLEGEYVVPAGTIGSSYPVCATMTMPDEETHEMEIAVTEFISSGGMAGFEELRINKKFTAQPKPVVENETPPGDDDEDRRRGGGSSSSDDDTTTPAATTTSEPTTTSLNEEITTDTTSPDTTNSDDKKKEPSSTPTWLWVVFAFFLAFFVVAIMIVAITFFKNLNQPEGNGNIYSNINDHDNVSNGGIDKNEKDF